MFVSSNIIKDIASSNLSRLVKKENNIIKKQIIRKNSIKTKLNKIWLGFLVKGVTDSYIKKLIAEREYFAKEKNFYKNLILMCNSSVGGKIYVTEEMRKKLK